MTFWSLLDVVHRNHKHKFEKIQVADHQKLEEESRSCESVHRECEMYKYQMDHKLKNQYERRATRRQKRCYNFEYWNEMIWPLYQLTVELQLKMSVYNTVSVFL